MSAITHEDLLDIFDCLNTNLKANNLHLELDIYGGCVMVLCLDARPATKDIDAVFETSDILNNILSDIALVYGLSDDWINQDIREPLSYLKNNTMEQFKKYSNLTVFVPSIEQMVAMKILSARPEPYRDFADVEYILKHLGITKLEDVLSICAKYYSRSLIGQRQKMFLNYVGKDLNLNWKEF